MTAPNRSETLFARALQSIPGGVNSPVRAFRAVGGTPFFTVSASGAELTTVDDRTLIDYVGTWGPAIHGHNHPVLREAIADALVRGTSFGTPHPAEIDIAETIIARVPAIEKVRLCNSGTEATMSCVRLARGCTGRDKIVKFAGCYHGHVDSLLVKAGSGALTLGNPDSAGIPAAVARETIVLPFNDEVAVRDAFAAHGDTIAGVILEPYPANVGLIPAQPGFLASLREICNTYGSLLIFDEVMTGFRIAPGGVQEREGVTPDLTALGKIIGGGLPVGAFGGRTDLMDKLSPLGPVYQAGTLSGNPLAVAAGLASLTLLHEEHPYESLDRKGRLLADAARSAAGEKGLPLQVPQCGSMFSLFFAESPVLNYDDATASATDHFKKLFHYALDQGVYLPPSPFETAFISTAHTNTQLERTAEVLSNGIRKL